MEAWHRIECRRYRHPSARTSSTNLATISMTMRGHMTTQDLSFDCTLTRRDGS